MLKRKVDFAFISNGLVLEWVRLENCTDLLPREHGTHTSWPMPKRMNDPRSTRSPYAAVNPDGRVV
jgi:hypothetical protein